MRYFGRSGLPTSKALQKREVQREPDRRRRIQFANQVSVGFELRPVVIDFLLDKSVERLAFGKIDDFVICLLYTSDAADE